MTADPARGSGPGQAPLPFEQLVRRRFSLRRYDPDRPVPDALVRAVLESARLAPSAENSQPWRFVAVTDPAARDRLARACFSGIFRPTRFAAEAPVILAVCAERAKPILRAGEAVLGTALYQLDLGIAGAHIVLAAAELGLGTCWIGWFDKRRARRELGVPGHVEVVCLISMGYPRAGVEPRAKVRRPLSGITFRDRWGQPFDAAGPGTAPTAAGDSGKG
jgi:nitroreductase